MIVIKQTLKSLILIFTLFLIGCGASLNTYQQQCEGNNKSFSAMVACMKHSLSNNETIDNPDLAKLYIAYADALSKKVQQKKISENDARLVLAKLNAEITTESNRRQQEKSRNLSLALQSWAAHQSAMNQQYIQPYSTLPITCHKQGNYINCW